MKDKLVVTGIVILIAMVGILLARESGKLGSVVQGNEYVATTTKSATGVTLTDRTLKTVGGVVSQVTITGAAAGQVTLCNATTSNASLRASSQATSSLTCINIPASTAAGTYIFDAEFPLGIILDTESTAPTSTILYR